MTNRSRRVALCVALSIGIHPALAAQQLAMTPLRTPPLLSPEQVRQERTGFLAMLDSSATRLSEPQLQSAREHLYLLIGSLAQAQAARTGKGFPARDTLGLAALFHYGSWLGMPGSGLVARALTKDVSSAPPTIEPTGRLTLAFEPPAYTLRSAAGWTARFPYYFMIGMAQTARPGNGIETDVVVLSTLHAAHRGLDGSSQATLMLIAATADSAAAAERFVGFWLKNLGVQPSDAAQTSLIPDSRTYRQSQSGEPMEKEVVALRRGRTVMLLGYLGLPGTFEANRADFLDVLRALRFADATTK